MSAEIDAIRQQLQARKNELLQRLEHVKDNLTRSHSNDWVEQAQERENDEVISALGNEAKQELSLINRALERINGDEYTTCRKCGEEIGLKRLQAVPYTDLCIRCAG